MAWGVYFLSHDSLRLSIFSQLKRIFTPKNDSSLDQPEAWLVDSLLGRIAAAGVRVTPLTVLGVPTVLACVNVVSRTMATTPLQLRKRTGPDTSEPAPEHPLSKLMTTAPVPGEVTSSSFFRAMQANATLRNKSFALIVKNGLNQVVEVIPIPPYEIQMDFNPVKRTIRYLLNGKEVPRSKLLIIDGLTFDGFRAGDPILLAKEAIGLTIALQDNAGRFFGNGSRPGGILSHPDSLSPDAQKNLKEKFEKESKGNAAYSLIVLEEGLTYTPQRETNTDAQFDESRNRQDHAIARIFGVQISKLGMLENAHYNNIEHESLAFVNDTMQPWWTSWEQSMNMSLLTPEEQGVYFFKFQGRWLLRGDALAMAQAHALGRNWGWLCADDVREDMGMNPLPNSEGKQFLKPLNMIDAGDDPLDVGQSDPAKGEDGQSSGDKKKPVKKKVKALARLMHTLLRR